MKIGIDCKHMLNVSGGEYAGVAHYTYYLVKELVTRFPQHEFVLFMHDPGVAVEPLLADNVRIRYMPFYSWKKWLPFVYGHIIAPFVYGREKVDCMHFPAPTVPVFYFGRYVVTAHDLSPYINPDWFENLSWFFTHVVIPHSFKRAKKIIAVSQSTKNDLMEYCHVPAEKIIVVYEGVRDLEQMTVAPEEVSERIRDLYPYLLSIGTIEPRKNVARVIEAFMLFIKQHPETKIKLAVAGKKGWKFGDVEALLADPSVAKRVEYLGYVSDAEKIYLYQNAFALVYPSLHEGFGLQLLGAMTTGTPIVTSNKGAIAEVVLDNALFVDPLDVADIACALGQMYEDDELREGMREKGRAIAKTFTWKACAEQTAAVYEDAAKSD